SRFLVSDLNNDSLPDLVTSSVNNGVYLLYNEGNFQLSAPVFIPVPLVGYDFINATCGDLDHNGYNDLIITQSGAEFINLLFNDGNGNFVENPITKIPHSNFDHQTSNLTCYPNPFKTELNINYNLTESSFVDISVFSLSGGLIKVLTHKQQEGEKYSLKWDGLDTGGKLCKPGAYLIYFMVNGKVSQSIKTLKF
ncbi:MAG: FG-GAP-like repeat-containing protein, partial [Bacteroidales bacterium]|nr:FG-GAP-like repeat-containing protein [Bacteroidales bacterium]